MTARQGGDLVVVDPRKSPGEHTREAEEAILAGVRRLLPLTHAAALGGVTRNTVLSWRNADPAFDLELRQAKAQGQEEHLGRIRGASKGNPALWASNAWILERTDPANYGRRDQVQVEVTLAGLVAASMGEGDAVSLLRDPVSGRFERPDRAEDQALLHPGPGEGGPVSGAK